MPRVGQAERFALMCPVVDVVGSVCRHAWPMTVPAGGGHSLCILNVLQGRRVAGLGSEGPSRVP